MVTTETPKIFARKMAMIAQMYDNGEDAHPGFQYSITKQTTFGEKEIFVYHDVVDDTWFGETFDDYGWYELDPADLSRWMVIIKDAIKEGALV